VPFGTIWIPAASAPVQVSVTNFINPVTGRTTHLVQNGTSTVTCIDGAGGMQLGTMINPTHATVAAWGNDMATFNTNGMVTWSDGTVWMPATSVAQVTVTDYINPVTGKTTHLIQNGTLTAVFIDGAGELALGTMFNSTHAIVAAWGNDMATLNSDGTVTWSDGTVWNPTTSPSGRVTVTNYLNPVTGKTTHLVQNGTSTMAFIDGAGGIQLGTMIDATHALVAAWSNDIATFNTNGMVTWSEGTVWMPATSVAQVTVTDYINPVTGKTTHLIQNGTLTAVFIDGAGELALGTMFNSTHAIVAAWGNDMATLNSNGTVTWSDGTVWNPTNSPSGRVTVTNYLNPVTGKTTHLVQNGTSTMAFIDGAGGIQLGTMIDATHALVAAWGNDVATFNSNGTVTWSDGTLWQG